MAKYDVAARFQEVAKRARETGPINTGPKKKATGQMTNKDVDLINTASTRPGASMKKTGDVNLPISTASPEVKKRLGMK